MKLLLRKAVSEPVMLMDDGECVPAQLPELTCEVVCDVSTGGYIAAAMNSATLE